MAQIRMNGNWVDLLGGYVYICTAQDKKNSHYYKAVRFYTSSGDSCYAVFAGDKVEFFTEERILDRYSLFD